MDLGLNNAVALVTGSGRGIGLAIAETLHREGCNVAFNDRDWEPLDAILQRLGERASAHLGDVTDPVSCRAMIEEVVAHWGRLDVLICNVGSGRSVPPGAETQEEWRRVFELNLWSTTNTVEAARPHIEKSHGAIVCTSSICGIEALGAPLTYSAAKAALNSYVTGIARPLGKHGVRINAVAPGNIMFEGGTWARKIAEAPAAVAEMLYRDVSLGRLGTTEEIADFVAFLASPRAAFATGSVFVVDGGQVRS